jgi:hypothetical protein
MCYSSFVAFAGTTTVGRNVLETLAAGESSDLWFVSAGRCPNGKLASASALTNSARDAMRKDSKRERRDSNPRFTTIDIRKRKGSDRMG